MSTGGLTKQVAGYLADLRFDDLPEDVVRKTKDVILDQLGCQVSGAMLPWSKLLYSYISGFASEGESTLLAYGTRVHPELAALGNGSFGHGFDMDDLSREGVHHPAAGTVSPAIALGESGGASGKDVLLSVYAGWELSSRLGLVTEPSMMERGFHMMGTLGAFGSAFSSAKILNLDKKSIENALGIVGSLASTINEFTISGGDIKRLHGGIGASSGVRASLLAKAGYTGPGSVLEGEKGFCKVFAGDPKFELMLKDAGKMHYILNVCYKVYPCPAPMHGPVQALLELMSENSLDHRELKEIVVGTSKFVRGHLGSIGPRPKDILAAQYSLHFGMALTAIRGANNLKAYLETSLSDPRVIEMAETVKVEVDEEVERSWPNKMGGRTTLRTKDGREYSRKIDNPKGTPENPMTRDELETKFIANAQLAVPEDKARRAVDLITNLDSVASLGELTGLLVREGL